jgi:hypothetical protein
VARRAFCGLLEVGKLLDPVRPVAATRASRPSLPRRAETNLQGRLVGRFGFWFHPNPRRMTISHQRSRSTKKLLQKLPQSETAGVALVPPLPRSEFKMWSGARDLNPGPHGPEL